MFKNGSTSKLCHVVLLFTLLGLTAAADEPKPTVSMHLSLFPAELWNGDKVEVHAVLESDRPFQGVILRFQPSPGFRVNPPTITLDSFSGKISQVATLEVVDDKVRPAQKEVRAELALNAGAQLLASDTVQFKYDRRVETRLYLMVGLLAAVVGYLVRIVLKAVAALPAPPLAPPGPGDPVPGPISRFVNKYYYAVDGAVTIVLTLVFLLSLIKNGQAPESATYWYGVTVLGFSLGLLTNSELITKLRP